MSATTDHVSYNRPCQLQQTMSATTDHVTDHVSYNRPCQLQQTMSDTIDHVSYNRPRQLQQTMSATIDHVSYNRPCQLQQTMSATREHKCYNRPCQLQQTMGVTTDHVSYKRTYKCYNRPYKLKQRMSATTEYGCYNRSSQPQQTISATPGVTTDHVNHNKPCLLWHTISVSYKLNCETAACHLPAVSVPGSRPCSVCQWPLCRNEVPSQSHSASHTRFQACAAPVGIKLVTCTHILVYILCLLYHVSYYFTSCNIVCMCQRDISKTPLCAMNPFTRYSM